ncbi:MAG: L-rhamnose mutarotase [Emticicia sp.]|nr:L-rhamnose mutarotase [Emticicia sp.]
MKRYTLALDLVDDPTLIAEYEKLHERVSDDIAKSITDSGITEMEIYRIGNRLFMIMETEDDFSFERKSEMDVNNPKVQVWENFVWKYQQALPMAKPGEKWIIMKQIFKLTNQ